MENQRPWEQKHSHEDDLLEADLRIDAWTLHVLRGIGRRVEEIGKVVDATAKAVAGISKSQVILAKGNKNIMATLEDVQSLVTQTGVDAQETADRVLAAIAAVTDDSGAIIADLQAQIAALIAGNAADITPEALQPLADGLTAVHDKLATIAPTPPPIVG